MALLVVTMLLLATTSEAQRAGPVGPPGPGPDPTGRPSPGFKGGPLAPDQIVSATVGPGGWIETTPLA